MCRQWKQHQHQEEDEKKDDEKSHAISCILHYNGTCETKMQSTEKRRKFM
jgi:hypothetical protein